MFSEKGHIRGLFWGRVEVQEGGGGGVVVIEGRDEGSEVGAGFGILIG